MRGKTKLMLEKFSNDEKYEWVREIISIIMAVIVVAVIAAIVFGVILSVIIIQDKIAYKKEYKNNQYIITKFYEKEKLVEVDGVIVRQEEVKRQHERNS